MMRTSRGLGVEAVPVRVGREDLRPWGKDGHNSFVVNMLRHFIQVFSPSPRLARPSASHGSSSWGEDHNYNLINCLGSALQLLNCAQVGVWSWPLRHGLMHVKENIARDQRGEREVKLGRGGREFRKRLGAGIRSSPPPRASGNGP